MKLKQNRNNPNRVNLWDLPNIVNIDIKPVKYNPPKQFLVDHHIKEVREGLELLVQLSEPIPSRAITPSLYIGDTPIADYEVAGNNLYRFFVIEPNALEPNALIALGWHQLPKDQRIASNMRFQKGRTGLA